jgi:hypothetical protein
MQVNTPPKIQGFPTCLRIKRLLHDGGYTFSAAEQYDNFPDLGDVLHNEAACVKCLTAQPESGTLHLLQMRIRSDVLNIADN